MILLRWNGCISIHAEIDQGCGGSIMSFYIVPLCLAQLPPFVIFSRVSWFIVVQLCCRISAWLYDFVSLPCLNIFLAIFTRTEILCCMEQNLSKSGPFQSCLHRILDFMSCYLKAFLSCINDLATWWLDSTKLCAVCRLCITRLIC